METKKQYLAPELTVVTFKVETGFTASGGVDEIMLINDIYLNDDYNAQSQENWSESGTFGGDWSW